MLLFDKSRVEELLDMRGCIEAMRKVLVEYASGETVQVLRTAMPFEARKILGVMPAAIPSAAMVGAKLITVFPDNFRRGLPSHQGIVVLFSTDDGSLQTILDGEAITAVRTAAVSAAATDALARQDAHVLCMLGSGLQARKHLEAMRLVRRIDAVRVWDIDRESAARYKAEMEAAHGIPVTDCCTDVCAAVSGADIICTVTSAVEPILFGDHISLGTHVNAVGACGATHRELDSSAMQRARLFCDSRESCMGEAGDYLIPLERREIGAEHLLGEIGEVLSKRLEGRRSDSDITVFEAQGLAVEDLAAAHYILRKAGGTGV